MLQIIIETLDSDFPLLGGSPVYLGLSEPSLVEQLLQFLRTEDGVWMEADCIRSSFYTFCSDTRARNCKRSV